MKGILMALLMSTFGAISSHAQSKINPMENEIKNIILQAEQAAAERNLSELEKLLHPEYRVIANRFKGGTNTTVIPRNTYLDMMKAAKIGGISYTTEFRSISITDHTAMVELLYTTGQSSDMHKYLFLIQDENNDWKIVSDLPVVLE